jgi:ribosomal subunit interface protein
MKLVYTFKHLDYSKSLELYTQESVDRVSGFLLKEEEGHVLYSKSKSEFVVEVMVPTKQRFFRARASHFDIYSAVDEVIAKLEKQFLKTRKINQEHKKVTLSKQGKLERLNARFELKTRFRKAA